MKIGVVSDTHGFFDPRLKELLAGAEAILHAGDVGSQEVLDARQRGCEVAEAEALAHQTL
jgi:predicted phosphodiesterase